MKVYFIIALVMFLFCKCDGNNTNTTDTGGLDSVGEGCNGYSSDSYANCANKIGDYEKSLNFHCCLIRGKEHGAQISKCICLGEEEFNGIDEYEKYLEENHIVESPEIICHDESNNQSTIKFNSFFLLLLFLLLN